MRDLVKATITSMEVAQMVGKEHSKLLRDIREYSRQLAEAKIGLGDFFEKSSYLDANNQSCPFLFMCHQIREREAGAAEGRASF